MIWWETWWVWVAAGLVLAILELFAPGYVFAGVAVGAVIVGVLVALGVTPSLAWLLLIFAVVSALTWIVFRRALGTREGQTKTFDRDINED